MSVIFTSEYLAKAPRATVEITFPDGATWTTQPICDGNGMFVGSIRDAIGSWGTRRGSAVLECSRSLDKLRASHAAALVRDPARASSQWARVRS